MSVISKEGNLNKFVILIGSGAFYFLESSCLSISAFSKVANGIKKPHRGDHFFKQGFESKQYS